MRKIGLKVMKGDEAFYYLHKDGELIGAVITHVDDFTMAGTDEFIAETLEIVGKELTISKIEEDGFRYTGIDVVTLEDGIQLEMKDYVDSLEPVQEIRKAEKDELLTREELKMYRKMTGKLSWLANSTRPDLSYTALEMSKKNRTAQIKDLRDVSRIVNKAKAKSSKVKFSRIGPKDDLMIVAIGDASFKVEEKAIGGVLLFLTNSEMTRGAPIYWKAKTIARVCHSSKDAETLNVLTMVEDAVSTARQLEILLYGDYRKRMRVRVFTDSEPTLESIASSRQIERKTLRLTVTDLKERLLDGDVSSYSWLPTNSMWADMLTKEMEMPASLEEVIKQNRMALPLPLQNEVVAIGTEIRMKNIRNR